VQARRHHELLVVLPLEEPGAFGDGGAVLCDDAQMADKVVRAARARQPAQVHPPVVGGNFRLDALQAAILRVKLPQLAGWSKGRQAMPNDTAVCSRPHPGFQPSCACRRAWPYLQSFVIRAPRRTACASTFPSRAWGRGVLPAGLAPAALLCWSGLRTGAFPHAEAATREALALPIFAELTEEQQAYVVTQIAAYYH